MLTSDDDLHDQMARCDGLGNIDSIAPSLNISQEDKVFTFDPFELEAIEDHRHVSGVLELKVSHKTAYKDNDTSWHPLKWLRMKIPKQ